MKFTPSGYSGPLTIETASWDFYEADQGGRPVPLPYVRQSMSQVDLFPAQAAAQEAAAARRVAYQEAAARHIEESTSPGLAPLPVGAKEMVLISSGRGEDDLVPALKPIYKRDWFWPVVVFAVAVGVVSNDRRSK
jgi:hypothetical protein